MTLCEFYKNQYEQAKGSRWFDEDSKYIEKKYSRGSFEWFKAMSKRYFGGGFLHRYTDAGITARQLREAKENGYIKYVYDSSWKARQLKQQDWYGLTIKGLRTLYKAYEGQW